ncbi:TPA: hypothetical protein ACH3X2_000123 [Trebouxia sp. C0005]
MPSKSKQSRFMNEVEPAPLTFAWHLASAELAQEAAHSMYLLAQPRGECQVSAQLQDQLGNARHEVREEQQRSIQPQAQLQEA